MLDKSRLGAGLRSALSPLSGCRVDSDISSELVYSEVLFRLLGAAKSPGWFGSDKTMSEEFNHGSVNLSLLYRHMNQMSRNTDAGGASVLLYVYSSGMQVVRVTAKVVPHTNEWQ